MSNNTRYIIIGIVLVLAVIIVMKFAFKLGFVIAIFGVGFYLGHRFEKRRNN